MPLTNWVASEKIFAGGVGCGSDPGASPRAVPRKPPRGRIAAAPGGRPRAHLLRSGQRRSLQFSTFFFPLGIRSETLWQEPFKASNGLGRKVRPN